ncbi:MAG TPA: D-glycero-beta-D-manno-heptose 1-phosphate adenylyltransferase [Gemmatimonadota bacterium]|nr:D-glycero-beta-D-manno-heptose 1-phosphate adenylyltransferase [Gemmatimonadota bacterium]
MRSGSSIEGLRAAVRGFRGGRIVVYGDLMLDEYLFGRADRLSPEKPVPVVTFERRELFPGGAGNVVRNLGALGCEPVLIALVGDDDAGRECRARLENEGYGSEGLVLDPQRSTPHKTRVHAGQHALVRIDVEDPDGTSKRAQAELLEAIGRLAPGCDAAVVSDYRKGTVFAKAVRALADAVEPSPVVADPKGPDAERYRGARYLVPNEAELSELTGGPWDDAGADGLRRRLGLDALVLTRSERGVRVFAEGPARDHAARARQVFDVTGAGDTFAAVFTAMVAGGEDVDVAAGLANVAAGIKVRKIGTATVTRDEIEAELARELPPDAKRLDRHAVSAEAAARRRRGETVVFTNGCFDLLHAGHIEYLKASRAKGDCLIVGLNSDASVRRLKGEDRPILDQDERAEILSALSFVDYVVLFEEDTPLALIESIRPDILTKGADYEPHAVVGADRVRSWGGRVELIDIVEGKSTTDIIDRIAGRQSGVDA